MNLLRSRAPDGASAMRARRRRTRRLRKRFGRDADHAGAGPDDGAVREAA